MTLCCFEPLRLAFQSVLYRNRVEKFYHHALHLPLRANLTEGDEKVIVKVMTDEELVSTYHMIQDVSNRGEGFGVNQFAGLEDFRAHIKKTHKFAVTMETSGEHVASLFLAESEFSRGIHVAGPSIIVKADRSGQGLGQLCFDLSERFSKLLGFLGIYMEFFENNTAFIELAEERDGYVLVGKLPAGGLTADGTLMSTFIFYKDLRDPAKSELEDGVTETSS